MKAAENARLAEEREVVNVPCSDCSKHEYLHQLLALRVSAPRVLLALAFPVPAGARAGVSVEAHPLRRPLSRPAGRSTRSRGCSAQKVSESAEAAGRRGQQARRGRQHRRRHRRQVARPTATRSSWARSRPTRSIPALYASIPYDPVRDFAPVTQVASTPNVLVVNPSVPAIERRASSSPTRRRIPASSTFGSGSTGSAGHLAGELFKADGGRGDGARALQGRGAGDAGPHRRADPADVRQPRLVARRRCSAGRVKALAVTTAKRTALAPELPTIAGVGPARLRHQHLVRDLRARAARRATCVDRLHAEFTQALAAPDVREKMREPRRRARRQHARRNSRPTSSPRRRSTRA